MNNYQSNRDNRSSHNNRPDFSHQHEQRNTMRFDDYGSPARGGYGNEGRMGTFGNQGNEMGGSRDRGNDNTYSSSRNYGNMGSYGGAQGFGSSRGGYPSQRQQDSDMRRAFDSGMGHMGGMPDNQSGRQDRDRSQGIRDYDSHGGGSMVRDVNYSRNNDLYGSDSSRRFQGRDQDRYNFNTDNRSRSDNYGGSEGNYMGSGYNRTSRPGEYGAMGGYYGGSGSYSSERYNSSDNRSRDYRGGHGPNSDYGNNRDRNMQDYDRY